MSTPRKNLIANVPQNAETEQKRKMAWRNAINDNYPINTQGLNGINLGLGDCEIADTIRNNYLGKTANDYFKP